MKYNIYLIKENEMFVIAFKERYREEYYTGKRYKYDGNIKW